MDNIFLDFFFFFVPNRLLWDGDLENGSWERFQGAQDDPGDSIDFEVPIIEGSIPGTGLLVTSLDIYDYFGLPLGQYPAATVDAPNALHLRAYNQIYNSWFRDQNLHPRLLKIRGQGRTHKRTIPFFVVESGTTISRRLLSLLKKAMP